MRGPYFSAFEEVFYRKILILFELLNVFKILTTSMQITDNLSFAQAIFLEKNIE